MADRGRESKVIFGWSKFQTRRSTWYELSERQSLIMVVRASNNVSWSLISLIFACRFRFLLYVNDRDLSGIEWRRECFFSYNTPSNKELNDDDIRYKDDDE